ncbi:YqeB family protein [Actinoplanes sp. CA-131856]
MTTTVPTPWWLRTLVWITAPALGFGAALLLRLLGGVEWLPGPFGLIEELPSVVTTYVTPGLGVILGLVLAAMVDAESLKVRVSTAEVELTRPGHRRVVPRADIAVVFPDRDKLVLLGRTGQELAREPTLLMSRRLRAAFTEHGVPWADEDPYLAAYRRWVPDLPDISPAANAILAERQKALKSGDEDELRDLREELGRLGVVVRDVKKKQYWRHAS